MKLNRTYTRKELFELAFKDALTGVYNRNALEATREEYDHLNIWVSIVDIDNLKFINDTYGHAAGDKVILSVVRQLRNISEDVIRLGGDEFLILSKRAINEPIVGASYGCYFKRGTTTLTQAMHYVDKRMYQNKRNKRNLTQVK